MSDNGVWVIYQYGVPIAAITDGIEAVKEYNYLSHHGDGYQMKWLPLETKAGGYAER